MFLKFNQKPPTFTSKRLSNIFIHVYEKNPSRTPILTDGGVPSQNDNEI